MEELSKGSPDYEAVGADYNCTPGASFGTFRLVPRGSGDIRILPPLSWLQQHQTAGKAALVLLGTVLVLLVRKYLTTRFARDTETQRKTTTSLYSPPRGGRGPGDR